MGVSTHTEHQSRQTIPHIVTHDGDHHASEALAVHLLRKLPQYTQARLTRTSDPTIIKSATIVVGVGGECTPGRRRFDCHRPGFKETFDKGDQIPLSSAGLIWKYFGKAILAEHLTIAATDERVTMMHKKMYSEFIKEVDAIDNGLPMYPFANGIRPAYPASGTDLTTRVSLLNQTWGEALSTNPTEREADAMRRFERACALAGGEFFDRLDYNWRSWLPARAMTEEAIRKRKTIVGGDPLGRILVFDVYPGLSHLFKLEKQMRIPAQERILYIVHPDETQRWRVHCTSGKMGTFECRKPLPEPWRGVRDEALSMLTGIEGCVFVHPSGYMAGTTSKGAALKMAHLALQT